MVIEEQEEDKECSINQVIQVSIQEVQMREKALNEVKMLRELMYIRQCQEWETYQECDSLISYTQLYLCRSSQDDGQKDGFEMNLR